MSVVDSDDQLKGCAKQIHAELSEALATKNVAAVHNHICLIDSLELQSNPIYYLILCEINDTQSSAISLGREMLQKWRDELNVGDYIDKFSTVDSVSQSNPMSS